MIIWPTFCQQGFDSEVLMAAERTGNDWNYFLGLFYSSELRQQSWSGYFISASTRVLGYCRVCTSLCWSLEKKSTLAKDFWSDRIFLFMLSSCSRKQMFSSCREESAQPYVLHENMIPLHWFKLSKIWEHCGLRNWVILLVLSLLLYHLQ